MQVHDLNGGRAKARIHRDVLPKSAGLRTNGNFDAILKRCELQDRLGTCAQLALHGVDLTQEKYRSLVTALACCFRSKSEKLPILLLMYGPSFKYSSDWGAGFHWPRLTPGEPLLSGAR